MTAATKVKVKKKMFENLDRAEIRNLAIFGMKLSPHQAYHLDSKQLVTWVHDRALEVPAEEVTGDRGVDTRSFLDADLEAVIARQREERETFREGVLDYISRLREFVRGESEKEPGWPPIKDGTEEVVVKDATPPKEKEPVKRRRGRPRKTETVNNKTPQKAAPKAKVTPKVAPAPAATAKPKKKIKKTKFGTKAEPTVVAQVSESSQTEVLEAIKVLETQVTEITQTIKDISAFTDGLASGIKDGFERMNEQVTAIRAEQTAAHNLLGNALLFLMNSAIFEQGEEKADLAAIPEPSVYLDIEE